MTVPTIIDLLIAYGVCFGLQNKVEVLRSHQWPLGAFFTRMLTCSYCSGFHCGWLAWLMTRPIYGVEASVAAATHSLAWAFASSAFCYLVDAASQAAERIALPPQKD
ncbi:MAG: hypothetical protein FJ096_02375 [Deltaproteobacteria bacterium]|nr:hypothetical protein [Deltaproteobacteria bacterium]